MSDFLENIPKTPESSDLQQLALLVYALKNVREEIAKMEADLKILSERERILSGTDIPEFLMNYQLSSLSLSSGESVEVVQDLSVSLPKKDFEKKMQALEWIEEHEGKGIVKETLSVDGPDETLLQELREKHIQYIYDKEIHASSLKAYFKSLLGMKKGTFPKVDITEIPKSLNIFVYYKTEIK